jgi:transketolase N-terminal domain/subunit
MVVRVWRAVEEDGAMRHFTLQADPSKSLRTKPGQAHGDVDTPEGAEVSSGSMGHSLLGLAAGMAVPDSMLSPVETRSRTLGKFRADQNNL